MFFFFFWGGGGRAGGLFEWVWGIWVNFFWWVRGWFWNRFLRVRVGFWVGLGAVWLRSGFAKNKENLNVVPILAEAN